MQTDNLDSFEKLIFSTPSKKKLVALNLIESLLFGSLTYWVIKKFTSISLEPLSLGSLVVFIYLIPALASAKGVEWMFKKFKGDWGFLLTAINQFVFFLFSIVILATDSIATAWNVLWIALITVYMMNILILSLTLGNNKTKKIILTGGIQPVLVLASFHIFFGRALRIPLETYILNLGLVAAAGVSMLLLLLILEYLISSNISNISALNLTSSLIQNKKETLDVGYPCRVEVQSLEIENTEKLRIGAPWAHPGPIGGFGGGDLTQNFIERLNTDSEGFFFHVPSNHEEDLVSPDDQEKLFDALSQPEKTSNASKMIEKDIGYGKLYGRRLGDKKIIFIDIYDYDDYEVAVFKETLDLKDTLIVDLHNEPESKSKEMYYGTSIAENLRSKIRKFEKEVEKLDLHDYRAGFKVENGEKSILAIEEEVNGQKTAIMGFDYNGLPEGMETLEERTEKDYDNFLVLSTDTHSSLDELAERHDYKIEDAVKCLKEASEEVKSAKIGLSMEKSGKVDLIKKDYSSLIFSINILVRFLLISLVFLYLGMIFWLL